MDICRVVDIETLCEEPRPGGIVEIGYTDVVATNKDLLGAPIDWEVRLGAGYLVNPMQPIPPETMAVHHIIDEDVAGAPVWRDVYPLVFSAPVLAYVAHGAKFEREWISDEITGATPWIDTYRCALRLYPESPTFSNNGLRYFLKPEGIVREFCHPPHRALPDSYVTAHLVRDFLNAGNTVEQLVKWTNEPALLPRCKIGDQYRNGGKGTPWPDVETSMLKWILSKDFGEDVVFTVQKELERREIDQRLEREQRDLDRQFRQNVFTGVDMAAGPDTSAARVDTEDAAMIPIEVYRAYDFIISPTGRILKDVRPKPAPEQKGTFL